MIEAAIHNARIHNCAMANDAEDRRMRHCEVCEVPIGIMDLAQFEKLTTCKACGGKIHCERVEEGEEWISQTTARILTGTRGSRIRRAIIAGKIGVLENVKRGECLRKRDVMREFG